MVPKGLMATSHAELRRALTLPILVRRPCSSRPLGYFRRPRIAAARSFEGFVYSQSFVFLSNFWNRAEHDNQTPATSTSIGTMRGVPALP